MEENDNFNIENQRPAAPSADDINAARDMGRTLFISFCNHPELTALLYDNLLDIKKEALRDAVALAMSGDEKGLLDLLSRQENCPAAGGDQKSRPQCGRRQKKADQ